MNAFFNQLKQRRVYRVAIGYAIVAWAAVQVAATVLPAFHAPEVILPLLIVLLGIGFPVALVLAWAFDVTPRGIERAPEGTEAVAATNLRYAWGLAGIGLVVAAAGVGGYWFWHHAGAAGKTDVPSPRAAQNIASISSVVPEKSIAVLPFENLSRDPDNAFFSSGIQDEILTRLAKIGALKVISRTSTQQYQSKPGNLSEIAKKLGVAHILEGSVQKVGNAVHINVQLIKAATDAQVWAEIYDRQLDDIFRVEGEVAAAIAEALNAKVTGNEKAAITTEETMNAEAYDAYLRGLALYRKSDDDNARIAARRFFEQAVELDPGFATAWARLARISSLEFFNGQDATEARRDEARAALDNALRLQPELAEAQLAQGYYQYWVERDYNGAAGHFEELLRKWPNNGDILGALGLIRRRQGHWDQARTYLERTVELDPLSQDIRLNLIDLLTLTRDFPAALRGIDEALNLWPDSLTFIVAKALAYQQVGDLNRAEEMLKGKDPQSTVITSIIAFANQAELRRKYPEAIAQLQALLQRGDANAWGAYTSSFVKRNLGDLQRLAGDAAAAKANYLEAREDLLAILNVQPNNADLFDALSLVYCGLGDREEALRCSDRAMSLMPVSKDALSGNLIESTRAQIYARFNDRDHAIELLDRLLRVPGYLAPAILRFAPDFDLLRGDPRFEKLCQDKPL